MPDRVNVCCRLSVPLSVVSPVTVSVRLVVSVVSFVCVSDVVPDIVPFVALVCVPVFFVWSVVSFVVVDVLFTVVSISPLLVDIEVRLSVRVSVPAFVCLSRFEKSALS